MKVFELFDEEGTGFITFKSLKRVCEELNEPLYVSITLTPNSCRILNYLLCIQVGRRGSRND
jgi:hypothetical protein